MSTTLANVHPRVQAFMEALGRAQGTELCRPPGFGLYRVSQVRRGLELGAVQVHHSGEGFALTVDPMPGKAHRVQPTAALLQWEREVDAGDDRPVTNSAERRAAVAAEVALLDFTMPPLQRKREPEPRPLDNEIVKRYLTNVEAKRAAKTSVVRLDEE